MKKNILLSFIFPAVSLLPLLSISCKETTTINNTLDTSNNTIDIDNSGTTDTNDKNTNSTNTGTTDTDNKNIGNSSVDTTDTNDKNTDSTNTGTADTNDKKDDNKDTNNENTDDTDPEQPNRLHRIFQRKLLSASQISEITTQFSFELSKEGKKFVANKGAKALIEIVNKAIDETKKYDTIEMLKSQERIAYTYFMEDNDIKKYFDIKIPENLMPWGHKLLIEFLKKGEEKNMPCIYIQILCPDMIKNNLMGKESEGYIYLDLSDAD
ncbi:hypothetical protein [Metamycoplasma hominis]|uniref:hypothetical protein n=1 Tax=Metamycoplasma hominis TaxID=2098 RepID=UPI00093E4915|nr:hypothetical protein [Metamycoplasma hominis]OKL23584.1 hypothetical protein BRO51_01700 [Metamycoplasma hominis]RBI33969.1 hypothetical protein DRZ74_01735 [Metamycoplasma hominis]